MPGNLRGNSCSRSKTKIKNKKIAFLSFWQWKIGKNTRTKGDQHKQKGAQWSSIRITHGRQLIFTSRKKNTMVFRDVNCYCPVHDCSQNDHVRIAIVSGEYGAVSYLPDLDRSPDSAGFNVSISRNRLSILQNIFTLGIVLLWYLSPYERNSAFVLLPPSHRSKNVYIL